MQDTSDNNIHVEILMSFRRKLKLRSLVIDKWKYMYVLKVDILRKSPNHNLVRWYPTSLVCQEPLCCLLYWFCFLQIIFAIQNFSYILQKRMLRVLLFSFVLYYLIEEQPYFSLFYAFVQLSNLGCIILTKNNIYKLLDICFLSKQN